jgi:hypothetical protein
MEGHCPLYIVFGSGHETYDPAWAPGIKTIEILEKDGELLAWRYTCNTKGNANEEFCVDYVENILQACARIPSPRDTHSV